MVGRSGWCLLVAGFVISVSAFIAGQAGASARVAPRVLTEPASGQIHPGRIVRPTRPPLPSLPRPILLPGVFGFPAFVRAAGMIFSGTVTRIERRAASGGQSVETVAVTFHVENAVRGVSPGQDLTITQWIGLWSSGQRYRVGERVVLFLYPNSKLGLTSTVGGSLGHFAVDRAGWVLLTAQHLAAFRRDPVLGGKSRARFGDFALAVRQAGEEERLR
ncbi:MAG TPA: hypothetical protein VNS62_09505 [Candidatus Udaeobacter sp.]|nr:hypothetical protein [Candidatus Udaeobacter sp.]